jgi:hypothetical protein
VASFDEAVPPGQEGHLDVKIHTANLRGTVRKTVRLTTNDPTHPDRVLRVLVRVVGSVDVLPRSRLLLSERGKNPLQAEVVIRKDETETGTLEITDAAANVPWIAPSTQRVVEAGGVAAGNVRTRPGDWILTVRSEADLAAGNHRGSVTFRTGLDREPTVTIPVTTVIRNPMNVSARQILLHRPAQGSDTRGAFMVSLRPALDPEELELSVEPDAFRLVTESGGPRGVRVYVVLADRGDATPESGTVTVRHGEHNARVQIRVIPRASASGRPSSSPESRR